MDEINNVWPQWHTVELLGRGSFGKVYKVKREEMGNVYYSAVKVLHIPRDEGEIRELEHSGMDFSSIHAYFQDMTQNLLNEIQIMESLKSASNIVGIEDHQVRVHKNEIGWDIFIRMELLTSLNSYLSANNNDMSKDAVVKLAIDMCQALAACEKVGVIHRDIKPDNVFLNRFGSFKLGDFGISKQLENKSSALSQKGTDMYMAPEVLRGEKYNRTVDIYSLGIMLYRLLNRGRYPFQPPKGIDMLHEDIVRAQEKRLTGVQMMIPAMADETLGKIVLKACEFRSENRYQSAEEMLVELKNYVANASASNTQGEEPANLIDESTHSAFGDYRDIFQELPEKDEKSHESLDPHQETPLSDTDTKRKGKKKGKSKKKIVGIAVAAVVVIAALGVGAFFLRPWDTPDESGLAEEYTTLDKLKISARMPEGWEADQSEDAAWADITEDTVEKEISFSMDFNYAAVNELDYYVGLQVEDTEGMAANGAEDGFAQTILYDSLQDTYRTDYKSNGGENTKYKTFADLLATVEESAVYEINGREYYYLQYLTYDGINLAFYYTVQDHAKIYYRLRVENGTITTQDRQLFDNVMRTVEMDTDAVDYSQLTAEDSEENIYELDTEMTTSTELGLSVYLPKVSEVSTENNQITAKYSNSDGDKAYAISIEEEELSDSVTLENGMNEEIANSLMDREEQDRGKVILSHKYMTLGNRNYLRMILSDEGGTSLTYMTMYKGKLLNSSFHISDVNESIDAEAKKMMKNILDSAQFYE